MIFNMACDFLWCWLLSDYFLQTSRVFNNKLIFF